MCLSIKDEIKKDLCRQYSENENHRQTILISFLAVLIASSTLISMALKDFVHSPNEKTLWLLFIAVVFNIFIFSIPIIISIILGYMLRRDQLIVDEIRIEEFDKSEYEKLFKHYSPFKKGRDFLQELNKFFIITSLIFQGLFVLIFFISMCCFLHCSCYSSNIFFVIFLFLFLIICYLIQYIIFSKYNVKFQKKSSHFKQ